MQRVPQVRIVERAQWALAFLEAARAGRFAFQMGAQHPGELFGVSGLMDDEVMHRPRFTPGTGIGSALLHRVYKGLPFGESVSVDLSLHGLGYTRDL